MFEWDEAKAASNLRKHGVPFEFAVRVFDDPARVEFDVSRPGDNELRRKCVGRIDGRLFVIVFHKRGQQPPDHFGAPHKCHRGQSLCRRFA